MAAPSVEPDGWDDYWRLKGCAKR